MYAEGARKDVEMSGIGFAREGADDDEDLTYLQPLPGPKYSSIPRQSRELPTPCQSLTDSTMTKEHAYSSTHTEHAEQSTADDHHHHNYESLGDFSRQADSQLAGGEENEKANEGVPADKESLHIHTGRVTRSA